LGHDEKLGNFIPNLALQTSLSEKEDIKITMASNLKEKETQIMAKNGAMATIVGESTSSEDSTVREEVTTFTFNRGSSVHQELGLNDENSFHRDNDDSNESESSMDREELTILANNRGNSVDYERGLSDENSFHPENDDSNEYETIEEACVSVPQDETTPSELLPRFFRPPCPAEHEHSNDYSDKATSYTYPTLEEFQKIGAIMNMSHLRLPDLSPSDASSSNGSQAGSNLLMLRQSHAWSQDSSDQDHHRYHHDWHTDRFYSRVNNSFTDSPISTRI
jgi:hypothetical protein